MELKNGIELVVSGDKFFNYISGWDLEIDVYGIIIYNVKVDEKLRLLGWKVGSFLVWVKIC